MPFLWLYLVAAPEKIMSIFRKRQQTAPMISLKDFPPDRFEPVIRASICTGEKTACMRERESGRLHEVMLIHTEAEMDAFCRSAGVQKESVKTVY